MSPADQFAQLLPLLMGRLEEVRRQFGLDGEARPDLPLAVLLDSMALVEFQQAVADDLGVGVGELGRLVGRRFTTAEDLAGRLAAAGVSPALPPCPGAAPGPALAERVRPPCWIGVPVAALPAGREESARLDARLGRPGGWLARHAGISALSRWGEEDPVGATARACRECLEAASLAPADVGVLVVTGEAPPLLTGLGAALHHALGLAPDCVPLEVGGACTGWLVALHAARHLLASTPTALLVAVEAPSRHLAVAPGPAGEAHALFGDGAAACLVRAAPRLPGDRPLLDLAVRADGAGRGLVRVEGTPAGVEVHLGGVELAGRAVAALAAAARGVAGHLPELPPVVAHGGNGRMPALVARALRVPGDRVLSLVGSVGNLGSASLPVAWAAAPAPAPGPLVLAAVGAGLLSGAALLGAPGENRG